MVLPVVFAGLLCGLFALVIAYPILRLRGVLLVRRVAPVTVQAA